MVAHRLGISLLPTWAVREEMEAGKLAQMRVANPRLLRAGAVVSLGRFQSSPTRAFLAYILDNRDKLQAMARRG